MDTNLDWDIPYARDCSQLTEEGQQRQSTAVRNGLTQLSSPARTHRPTADRQKRVKRINSRVRDPSRPRATSPSRTGTFGSADGLPARVARLPGYVPGPA